MAAAQTENHDSIERAERCLFSPLQNLFISVQRDLFWPHRQYNVSGPGGVAADSELADAHHPFAKISKHRNQTQLQ